jgi:hypothetical protein
VNAHRRQDSPRYRSHNRSRRAPTCRQSSRARDRYLAIAGRLKAAAGITEHIEHKKVSGLAWLGTGRILAPAGITRRQLYVLAHECGHIVLHSRETKRKKPKHVIEHEAEVFAHRALRRYGLEVPEKSAMWARGYVAECIRADRAKGIPICWMAEAFVDGTRSAYARLPSVEARISSCLARGRQSIDPPARQRSLLGWWGSVFFERIWRIAAGPPGRGARNIRTIANSNG